MPECQNCESHVTPQFSRVFTQDGGDPLCCPECAPTRQILDGGAENPGQTWPARNGPGKITAGGDD